jgi:hypothetical protein
VSLVNMLTSLGSLPLETTIPGELQLVRGSAVTEVQRPCSSVLAERALVAVPAAATLDTGGNRRDGRLETWPQSWVRQGAATRSSSGITPAHTGQS